jgi:hypothetical protein
MITLESLVRTHRFITRDFMVHVQIPICLVVFSRHAYRLVAGSVKPSWKRLEGFPRSLEDVEPQESVPAENAESAVVEGENAQNHNDPTKVLDTVEATAEESVHTAEDMSESAESKGFSTDRKLNDEIPWDSPKEIAKNIREMKHKYEILGLKSENDMIRWANSVSAHHIVLADPVLMIGSSTLL